jgi:hypothetical protein
MCFVWNGKSTKAIVKAMALTKGYELDALLSQAGDSVLTVLFNGGVIRGKKLQRGSVYVFDDVLNQMEDPNQNGDNPNTPSTDKIIKTYETVYLFKFLLPE